VASLNIIRVLGWSFAHPAMSMAPMAKQAGSSLVPILIDVTGCLGCGRETFMALAGR